MPPKTSKAPTPKKTALQMKVRSPSCFLKECPGLGLGDSEEALYSYMAEPTIWEAFQTHLASRGSDYRGSPNEATLKKEVLEEWYTSKYISPESTDGWEKVEHKALYIMAIIRFNRSRRQVWAGKTDADFDQMFHDVNAMFSFMNAHNSDKDRLLPYRKMLQQYQKKTGRTQTNTGNTRATVKSISVLSIISGHKFFFVSVMLLVSIIVILSSFILSWNFVLLLVLVLVLALIIVLAFLVYLANLSPRTQPPQVSKKRRQSSRAIQSQNDDDDEYSPRVASSSIRRTYKRRTPRANTERELDEGAEGPLQEIEEKERDDEFFEVSPL